MGVLKKQYKTKGMNILIRNAEIEDANKIIDFMKSIDVETKFLSREPGEFNITKEQEEVWIKNKKESHTSLLIIAEVNGAVIGTCGLNGNCSERFKHSAEIGVVIKKKYWGLGIGKEIMNQAINWGKEKGLQRITLGVDSNNTKAINLYLNLGFMIEGRREKYKKLADGTYISSYIMALLFIE